MLKSYETNRINKIRWGVKNALKKTPQNKTLLDILWLIETIEHMDNRIPDAIMNVVDIACGVVDDTQALYDLARVVRIYRELEKQK